MVPGWKGNNSPVFCHTWSGDMLKVFWQYFPQVANYSPLRRWIRPLAKRFPIFFKITLLSSSRAGEELAWGCTVTAIIIGKHLVRVEEVTVDH